jgi:hypothetical protein
VECNSQTDLDEIEEALTKIEAIHKRAFSLRLGGGLLIFHNPHRFAGCLKSLMLDAVTVQPGDTDVLVRANPSLLHVTILHPAAAELHALEELLGLRLQLATFTDADLAALEHNSFRALRTFHIDCRRGLLTLGEGLASAVSSCHELRSLFLDRMTVSGAAVVAVCTHCPKLGTVHIPGGYLTSAAVAALTAARAPLQDVTIGWKVLSAIGLAVGAPTFGRLQSFTVTTIDPACTGTFECALSCMPSLESFVVITVEHWGVQSYLPAQGLVQLARHSPKLRQLFIHQPVVGGSEDCLIDVFTHCRQLRNLISTDLGMDFTDNVALTMAQYCGRLGTVDIRQETEITDAGVSALAEGCPDLLSAFIVCSGGIPKHFIRHPQTL